MGCNVGVISDGSRVGVLDVARLGERVGCAVRVIVGTSVGLDVAILIDPDDFEGDNEPLTALDGAEEYRDCELVDGIEEFNEDV